MFSMKQLTRLCGLLGLVLRLMGIVCFLFVRSFAGLPCGAIFVPRESSGLRRLVPVELTLIYFPCLPFFHTVPIKTKGHSTCNCIEIKVCCPVCTYCLLCQIGAGHVQLKVSEKSLPSFFLYALMKEFSPEITFPSPVSALSSRSSTIS